MDTHEQAIQAHMLHARQKQFERMVARQQQAGRNAEAQKNGSGDYIPLPAEMAVASGFVRSSYDGLAITHPTDLSFIGEKPNHVVNFEAACKQNNSPAVQSIVSLETCTPAFLHHGLTIALGAGNIEVARYLLSAGAPIVGRTAGHVLSAPSDKQITLFELLTQHGWTPNTPGEQGVVLLPKTVTNPPLLRWFLAHGANPNLGPSGLKPEATGKSCAALEAAAARGDVEAVGLLLDAGAEIQNGNPLHYAAGACQPGTQHVQMGSMQLDANVLPPNTLQVASKEFDVSRIPVMALLVERGADVNQRGESRLVAHHAIMYAVMAGAVERVRWLLAHGADPEARGAWGSAVEYVATMGSEAMRMVVEEGVQARQPNFGLMHNTLVVRTKPGPS
ncbi:uncharacterized protein N7459_007326 [Penicillium hispanicum]|uniref:uncharacterized protein n=1 Tax=Penicillium hispanicum TaxID=1080232 RepID=UPI0025412858|nr:uncharacterized protein N7459_007326 [Penicillium hispanicum]KAJ5578362.1 hypothetical protein N7459_007326 [Penicillium hispanicum]